MVDIQLLAVIGLIIGLVTIYLALWSQWGLRGLGGKIDRGFQRVSETGVTVAGQFDARMKDLIEIIRMLVEKGGPSGTVKYEMRNIGTVELSVLDMSESVTTYSIRMEKPLCLSSYFVQKVAESEDLRVKKVAFFGEKEVGLHCPLSNVLRVEIPSADKKVCSEFIAFLLNWLDTDYFKSLKSEVEERESAIGEYLKK